MKKQLFKLISIQLVIWLIYRTIEVLFWYYEQPDSLNYIIKYKLCQFLIPSATISLVTVILYLLFMKFSKNKYMKGGSLFISTLISFLAYFYIVSFYFRFIWVEEVHSMNLTHFVFAGYYNWLLFLVLNTACYLSDFWTDFQKQKLIINQLIITKEEINNNLLKYDSKLYFSDKTNGNYIQVGSIKYIQADTYMSKIITTSNKKIAVNCSLKKWEEKLPEKYFLRIHKSFIVNLEYIQSVRKLPNQTYEVYINDTISPIQMSRRAGTIFSARFKN